MGKNIVVVDDESRIRKIYKRFLTAEGYEVMEAANGVQALQMYIDYKPDLVLLDITMPEMDGIQTLKKLKEMDSGARVAMVTAMGQQSMVIEALKSGASDFVVKPFDAVRVLAAVDKLAR